MRFVPNFPNARDVRTTLPAKLDSIYANACECDSLDWIRVYVHGQPVH